MCFVFFNDTATTEIYTLSLHDALPISPSSQAAKRTTATKPLPFWRAMLRGACSLPNGRQACPTSSRRSEEHTSELQSRQYLVCRLLLEKKKQSFNIAQHPTWRTYELYA